MTVLTSESGLLRVASAYPDPPFEVTVDGEQTGFDRELMRLEETAAGASLDWNKVPHRQYVITLSGRLEFETRTGKKQTVEPGDILLAEDTAGASSTINHGAEPTLRYRRSVHGANRAVSFLSLAGG